MLKRPVFVRRASDIDFFRHGLDNGEYDKRMIKSFWCFMADFFHDRNILWGLAKKI